MLRGSAPLPKQERTWCPDGACALKRLSILALLAAYPLQASALQPVPLAPPASRLRYTVYALGLMPIQADFERFAGSLEYDPAKPANCRVRIKVEVASLHMDDPDRNRIALGVTMLDAAHYPSMRFSGRCQGAKLVGDLTLHGVTHRLSMTVSRNGTHVAATGVVQRREFGIKGLPGLVGEHVRFRLDADLPPGTPAGAS